MERKRKCYIKRPACTNNKRTKTHENFSSFILEIEDVACAIFRGLDLGTIKNCRLVCPGWRDRITGVLKMLAERKLRRDLPVVKGMPWYVYYLIYAKKIFERNLIPNSSGEYGMRFWKNFEGIWQVDQPPQDCQGLPTHWIFHRMNSCFSTNYFYSFKDCEMDLVKAGFPQHFIDTVQPPIEMSDWYCRQRKKLSLYCCSFNLCNKDGAVLATVCHQDPFPGLKRPTSPFDWECISELFTDYGPGLRRVMFRHGGRIFIKTAGACVRVLIPDKMPEKKDHRPIVVTPAMFAMTRRIAEAAKTAAAMRTRLGGPETTYKKNVLEPDSPPDADSSEEEKPKRAALMHKMPPPLQVFDLKSNRLTSQRIRCTPVARAIQAEIDHLATRDALIAQHATVRRPKLSTRTRRNSYPSCDKRSPDTSPVSPVKQSSNVTSRGKFTIVAPCTYGEIHYIPSSSSRNGKRSILHSPCTDAAMGITYSPDASQQSGGTRPEDVPFSPQVEQPKPRAASSSPRNETLSQTIPSTSSTPSPQITRSLTRATRAVRPGSTHHIDASFELEALTTETTRIDVSNTSATSRTSPSISSSSEPERFQK